MYMSDSTRYNRDAVLEPENLHYFAVTDGFAKDFGGVWTGRRQGVYAVETKRKTKIFESDGVGEITDASIPYRRVDGVDPNGEPVLVVLPTYGPEHDMIRTLINERRIFDNGPKSHSHREMTYPEVVEMCRKKRLVNTEAPIFERPTAVN